jgi:glutamate formiminotransferase
VELARRIAVQIREKDGGMKCVKAMGLQLEDGTAQVSMNLTDYRVSSPSDVVGAIAERAAAAGVAIRESEVVGLLPQDLLVRLAQAALHARDFGRDQVLEAQVLDTLL